MESKELASLDEVGLKYAYASGKGKAYTGGDKTSLGQNFTREYDTLLRPRRLERISILELGIFHGKSLSEFFRVPRQQGFQPGSRSRAAQF